MSPQLSVVIPSVNGWADLRPCLDAVFAQQGVRLEVLVADRVGEPLRSLVRESFPGARLVEAPPGTPIPQLRAAAFAEASAPVVGVIEDHVQPSADWGRRMLEAHAQGNEVVGGQVENAAAETLAEWTAFLCEYHQCLVPAPAGRASGLPGNNVTYRRALLERFRTIVEEGRWEDRLHGVLRDAGVALENRPDIKVFHVKHFTAREYVSQRFLYSRAYAGMRLRGSGAASRLAYGLAALGLPPILLTRILSRAWRAGVDRARLARALPLLTGFTLAWAGGELAGAWFGEGDALSRVC